MNSIEPSQVPKKHLGYGKQVQLRYQMYKRFLRISSSRSRHQRTCILADQLPFLSFATPRWLLPRSISCHCIKMNHQDVDPVVIPRRNKSTGTLDTDVEDVSYTSVYLHARQLNYIRAGLTNCKQPSYGFNTNSYRMAEEIHSHHHLSWLKKVSPALLRGYKTYHPYLCRRTTHLQLRGID